MLVNRLWIKHPAVLGYWGLWHHNHTTIRLTETGVIHWCTSPHTSRVVATTVTVDIWPWLKFTWHCCESNAKGIVLIIGGYVWLTGLMNLGRSVFSRLSGSYSPNNQSYACVHYLLATAYIVTSNHFQWVACWRSGIALPWCVLGSRFDPTVGS